MDKAYALNRIDGIANQLAAAHESLMLLGRTTGGEAGGYELRDEDGVSINLSSIADDLRAISNALE